MEENKSWKDRYWTALKHVYFQYEEGNIDSECYYNFKELVEKETPKKPIIRKEITNVIGLYENKISVCPNCGEPLTDDAGCYIDYHDVKYCPYCGQHIDWR